jgi:hypothetical protein
MGSTIIPAASDAANVSVEIAFFIIRVPVSSSKVAVIRRMRLSLMSGRRGGHKHLRLRMRYRIVRLRTE